MKEHPILFSGPMVRAILEGRKFQTRRIVKPQPSKHHWKILPGYRREIKLMECSNGLHAKVVDSIPVGTMQRRENDLDPVWIKCPYGSVGNILWVRETWGYCDRNHVIYRADDIEALAKERQWVSWPRWTPSIHMPRWASRISLKITDIRIERLQEISKEDALAEGVTLDPNCKKKWAVDHDPRMAFADLWDSINAKTFPWDKNPYVWCITFEAIKS